MQSYSRWGLGMCNLTIYLPQRHLQGSVWWYGKIGWKVFFKPQGKVTGMFIRENIQKVKAESRPQVWGEERWSGWDLVSAVKASKTTVSSWHSLNHLCSHLQEGERATLLAGTQGQGSRVLVQDMTPSPGPAGWTGTKPAGSWAASVSPLGAPCSLLPSEGVHLCAELSWGWCGVVSPQIWTWRSRPCGWQAESDCASSAPGPWPTYPCGLPGLMLKEWCVPREFYGKGWANRKE